MTETGHILPLDESALADEFGERQIALRLFRELMQKKQPVLVNGAFTKNWQDYFKDDELLCRFAHYYAAKEGRADITDALVSLHPDMDLHSALPNNPVNARGEAVSLAAPTTAVAEPAPEAAATPQAVKADMGEPSVAAQPPIATGAAEPAAANAAFALKERNTPPTTAPSRIGESIVKKARAKVGLKPATYNATSTASPNPVDPQVLPPKKSR